MANKFRSRSKMPGKEKQKRWKKGQSCVTNPEKNKHRSAAKNRFFSVNTGPSSLTVDAVVKHEALHAEMDDDLHRDLDSMTIGGRTTNSAATWATNFTNCSNMSFNKILQRFSTSSLAQHKEVLAVLAATADVIKSQGGNETDTEYFALLMSSLNSDTLQDDQSLAAAAYLLSIIIKRVPVAVLKSSFSDTAKVLLLVLNNKVNTTVPSLLKSVIMCLSHLLRVQDISAWNSEETKHVYHSVLVMVTFNKAKIRKCAQQAVTVILRASSFMVTDNAPAYHPVAQQTATFCINKLKEGGGNSSETVIPHILELLRHILCVFPKSSLKTTCESVIQVMTLSNVILRGIAMKTLCSMFCAQPKQECLPAEYNAKIIAVLYDYKPNDADVQPLEFWLQTMTQALCNLVKLDAQLCLTHLPRFFVAALKSMQSVTVAKSAANSLRTLIKDCIQSVKDVAAQMIITTTPGTSSPVHKIFRSLEAGLSYQYFAVWDLILVTMTDFIDVLGYECRDIMKKCLKSLADMRDSPGFQHRELLDKTIGTAVKTMGPRVVLEAVPLQITGESGESLSRSWMLPVMRDNIQGSELSFFVKYFLPLAMAIEKRSEEYKMARNVEYKTYEALVNQIWALLPGFCTRPTDLAEAFPSFAKTLGISIRDKADVRLELLTALRKLVTNSLENDKEKVIMSRYAQNFLPILFNMYVPTNEAKVKHMSTMAVLETIRVYFKICDPSHILQYSEKCYEKLSAENVPPAQEHALLDIVISLVPHLEKKCLAKYIEMSLSGLENKDKTIQKKSYRILEEIFSNESDKSRSVAQNHLEPIQQHLVKNLSTSGPSSKAPRLRCLHHLLQQMEKPADELIVAIIPEVVLCTKATGEKARQAAFSLLVEIGHSYIRWHPNRAPKDILLDYFSKLAAGLAGTNPHLIACTVLALTKILFDFKENVSFDVAVALVDSGVILLASNSREVVQAALGLVKALMSAFGDTIFSQFLQKVVTAIVNMKETMRSHFRTKIRELFTRLIRKYGYQLIIGMVPESQRKLLNHIRKLQERAKRKKKESEENDKDDESEEETKPKPESIGELLQDSDSDLDYEEDKSSWQKSNPAAAKKKQKGAWLKEDEDIIDFMDSSVATKVLTTRPEVKSAPNTQPVKHGFKTAADGRLIITETEEEKAKKSKRKNSDLDDLIDSMEDKSTKNRKRKRDSMNDSGDEDNDAAPMKYKAGGSGIHRPLKQKNSSDGIGKEYRAKHAAGDVKKQGKAEPYAYLPLQFQTLNKRKRAKSTGQFKNMVKGAKKGAAKSERQKNKQRK